MSHLPYRLVARLRGNHALEHATMHLLAKQTPCATLMAHTTPRGFTLYGQVTSEAVAQAARDAWSELQSGQRALAVHPNCGTNIVTAGLLAGLGAYLALAGHRNRNAWQRLSQVLWATTLGVIAAQPLGRWVQVSLTTSCQVANARVGEITSRGQGLLMRHNVEIRWS
jgi:hypothetical protein